MKTTAQTAKKQVPLYFTARPLHIWRGGFAHLLGFWRQWQVVGYAQSGLKFGATMVTPQFLNITNELAMPLEALVPQGDETSDNVEIQTLDAAGKTVSSYYWNDYMYDDPCWVDGDYTKVEGVTFAPGQGLWVFGSTTDQSIQVAGKVGLVDVTVQLRFGATPTGIPFPVGIALQDILPQGDETSDNVEIQTLDAAGKTVASYYWNDYMYDDPCWVDGDYTKVEGVTFEPGQGLWIFGSSSEQSIVFPAPGL